jgi:hypothetical protein
MTRLQELVPDANEYLPALEHHLLGSANFNLLAERGFSVTVERAITPNTEILRNEFRSSSFAFEI